MAYDYTRTIEDIFNSPSHRRRVYWGSFPEDLCIMEIPMGKVYDIPMFLAHKIDSLPITPETEAITVNLHSQGATPVHKTPDRYMRDILRTDLFIEGMVRLNNPDTNGAPFYYATHGMLLNGNLCPMMVAARRFEMVEDTEEFSTFIKNIIYINPNCYLDQNDKINKFIIKKIMQNAVGLRLYNGSEPVTIEIGTMPFNFRKVEVPDINTTNEELLQTAIDYADELTL